MRLSKLTVITMSGLLSTVLYATQVQAECNSELPYEQLVDCIVVEGSGAKYNIKEKTEEVKTISENESKQQEKVIALSE